jgi:acid phosphatase family membrane protein YuiD
VIRDSFGVRWSVGQQAKIINKLISHDHLHEKARVIAGHTVTQVVAGILLGIAIALVVHVVG